VRFLGFETVSDTSWRRIMSTSGLFSLKTSILIAVCLQNAGYTLIRKYSTMTEDVSSREILFLGEVIKVVISTYFTLENAQTRQEPSSAEGMGLKRLQWLVNNSIKMLVLAGIYGAMNILSFVALQYIGAGEFTICAQLKILSTAGFSVLILRRSLSWTKWRALMLLVLGCILVVSPSLDKSNKTESEAESGWLQLLGYSAVLTEVLLSGFASIYFEKVVKSTTEVVTIWERNFQLGLYSLMMYGSIMLYDAASRDRIPWSNWSSLTVLVSTFGAVGGLLVAATLKYADSILKTMAASGAIVLSTLLGWAFLDGPMGLVTCMGGGATIIAISNFTLDATPPPGTTAGRSTSRSAAAKEPTSLNSMASQNVLAREDSTGGGLSELEMQARGLMADQEER
jgi:UDP-sugar transporter A1/2/3